ncbi:hypothetical protein YC2023_035116 [Brassica napus]
MEGRDSDSDKARRLQTLEAFAASLSSRSRTPETQPSANTSAPATAAENGRNSSAPRGVSKNARRRNSRGKGKTHEAAAAGARGGYRNPNAKVGNFRNEYVYVPKKPSPSVVSSAKLVGEGGSTVKFSGDVLYRLYFKGLVSEESWTGKGKGKTADVAAGFGVAICDQRDGLLFELKGELLGLGLNPQGAEVKALTRGLTEASKLGIKHVVIFCDSYPIFQYKARYVLFVGLTESKFPLFCHNDDYEDDEDFDYGFGDFPFGFGQNMNGAKGSFDPYSELPAGVPHSRRMLEYKALHDMLRPGEEFASEDCPYFGKYGKYATFYDSDGYEYDDYTNPFHPDYD